MSTPTPATPPADLASDPKQKRRLIQGVLVWVAGWALAFGLVPLVQASNLSGSLKTTLNGILLLGCPKLFLILAIAIMGKPGFAYLKSLMGSHVRKLAPPATVSPLRYRIGLIMFVTLILLGSMGPYVAKDLIEVREQHPHMVAALGDILLLISLFLLGGDFWDKLRSLFIREAKVVFPPK
jgi:hypothetical protein